MVEIVKTLCWQKAEEWGRIEFEETRIGRLDHKVEKLQGIKGVLGVESLRPLGLSGDNGITMEENAPWGVILAITPVTHSVPTIAGNIINMVAAGNAIVVNPHPGGAKCAALAVREFNRAIHSELGISELICTIEEPTLESFNTLCASSDVDLLCITGGPAVVEAAMQTGKRAICAGPEILLSWSTIVRRWISIVWLAILFWVVVTTTTSFVLVKSRSSQLGCPTIN